MAAAAAVMAVVAAAGTAYSANQANKQAKAQYKHAKSEAGLQRIADKNAIEAAQRSPAAMFAPIMMGFSADVFGKAFAAHGIKMPVEQMKSAMGLDRIVRNNAAGLPWNYSDEQYASQKVKEAALARRGNVLSGVDIAQAEDLPRAGMGGGSNGVYADWYVRGDMPGQRNKEQAPAQPQQPQQPAAPAPAGNQNLRPMTADESSYVGGMRGRA